MMVNQTVNVKSYKAFWSNFKYVIWIIWTSAYFNLCLLYFNNGKGKAGENDFDCCLKDLLELRPQPLSFTRLRNSLTSDIIMQKHFFATTLISW